MSTIAKLRAIHEEVCSAWRKQSEPVISEGEAELISLGFVVLEGLIDCYKPGEGDYFPPNKETTSSIWLYVQHVHSQFDDDADMVISGE